MYFLLTNREETSADATSPCPTDKETSRNNTEFNCRNLGVCFSIRYFSSGRASVKKQLAICWGEGGRGKEREVL